MQVFGLHIKSFMHHIGLALLFNKQALKWTVNSKFCHNLHVFSNLHAFIFFVDNKKVIPKNIMFFSHTLEHGPILIWTLLACIV